MVSEFKTAITNDNKIIGVYDQDRDEYMLTIGDITYCFSEDVKGFRRTLDISPDYVLTDWDSVYHINDNKLYRFGTGDKLDYFGDNDQDVEFSFVQNAGLNVGKNFEAIQIHGSPCYTEIKTDGTTSPMTTHIESSEYEEREGEYYSCIPFDTVSTSKSVSNIISIGKVLSYNSGIITTTKTFNPSSLSIGDEIWQTDGTKHQKCGVISDFSTANNSITITPTATPISSRLIYSIKDARFNGDTMKGSYAIIRLLGDETFNIYSITTEIKESKL